MKKILTVFALIMALADSLTSCSGRDPGTEEAFTPTGEVSAQGVVVDIANDDNGFYDLLANVTVSFDDDGRLEWVYAENAVVLAFQVSDYYEGGVYIYSGTEMDEIVGTLKTIAESSAENAEALQAVIEQLENGGPIEGAST